MSQPAPSSAAATEENPYVGLTHFTEAYADRFFGRDTECALIIGNLRAARLTLLYAESGVGKSSVLRAGVVARLRGIADRDFQARGSPRLVPIVFSSWSEAPVAALIRAIDDAVRPYLAQETVLELPEDDLEAAIEAASGAIDATLLIILDQFEEYFLYPEDGAEQKRVAAQVARCINRSDLRANFLISIREDAYARLGDLFRGKIRNVYANFLHLDFLDRAGARESIERPLEHEPLEVEPALVSAVLDQVGRAPARSSEDGKGAEAKPGEEVETTYLQLVMRRLWEVETESGSHELRLRTLEDLGGAQAIISGHLDRAMEDGADGAAGLTGDQRRVAASVFQFLVTSGGTKIALTAEDLSDLSGLDKSEIDPVLRHLSSPRLHILRPIASEDAKAEPRFEIFHDALARPIVEWRTRVEEEELAAQVARERVEKESAQRAAAVAEQREAQERKRKRLALALLGVAVVALVGGAVYFGLEQRNLASQNEAGTQSVEAAGRILELSGDPAFGRAAAALASVEAYRLSSTTAARNQALAELQLNPGMPEIVVGHTRDVSAITYWPNSTKFASGGYDGTIRLWDAEGQELSSPLVDRSNAGVDSAAVSEPIKGGTRLVVAGLDSGTVRLWKVKESGEVLFAKQIPRAECGEFCRVEFNPRVPNMLAMGGSYKRITLWDLTNPRRPKLLGSRPPLGEVTDLAFDSGGHGLLVASNRGEEWELTDTGFANTGPVRRGPKDVFSVATAPNGSYAFGGDGWIKLWDAGRKRRLQLRLPGITWSLAFAGGGSVLVSGSADWNVVTWDVATGRPFGPPRSNPWGEIRDVDISGDGKTIAAAGAKGFVNLWPLDPPRPLAAVGSLSPRELGKRLPDIFGLAVGATGQVAVAGGSAGTSIWKLHNLSDTESTPRPSTWIRGKSTAAAYHGNLLAVGRRASFVLYDTGAGCRSMPAEPCELAAPVGPHSKGEVFNLELQKYEHRLLLASSRYWRGKETLSLWDATEARAGKITHLSSLLRTDTEIRAVAFSPASPLLAVAADDGRLRVWDVSNPTDPERIQVAHAGENEEQPIESVAFSPDGSLLASGGQDQQVVFWKVTRDASGPTVEATPSTVAQSQTIFSVAFSPDGKILAAGDGDGNTCLYEVESRRPIGGSRCLVGHYLGWLGYGGIEAVSFAQDSNGETSLLTAGTGQPIVAWSPLLWNLSDDDGVEQAIAEKICDLAGRNLTAHEWSAIFSSTKLADERRKTCPQYPLP